MVLLAMALRTASNAKRRRWLTLLGHLWRVAVLRFDCDAAVSVLGRARWKD